MRLILVRHGESVDNVAGLYAGSRDSALTAHGVLQTRRLGAHLAAMPSLAGSSGDVIATTDIFSSDLQRAFATASAILDAQQKRDGRNAGAAKEVIKSVDLRERDFRSGEGVRFGASAGDIDGSRNAFADAESRDEMRVRAERFIDAHLHPLLDANVEDTDKDARNRRAIVVVAHGLILNVLLSSLLQRYAPSELARLLPPATRAGGSDVAPRRRAELHVPWNNTGYLAMIVKAKTAGKNNEKSGDAGKCIGVQLQVTTVNCVEHLDGLKKTRGGIGSARFDPKQKTMDAFFGPSAKRQKRGDDA